MVTGRFTMGDHFESYRIKRLLARGLTTETYLAVNVETGQRVALKCRDTRGSGPQAPSEADFRAELGRMMGLCGPNIPAVLDGGITGDVLWLATDFMVGHPIRIGSKYSILEGLAAALTILESLASAHGKCGIVHGDLHPQSILGTEGDEPAVVGIGCAALFGLNRDSARDAPLYRAPEQLSGSGPVDVRSDIYSMGMVLYAMLAGRHPFANGRGALPRRGDLLALAERGGHEFLTPLTAIRGATARVAWDIIMRAVDPDPAKRFQSWGSLRSEIGGATIMCLSEEPEERGIAADALMQMHERQGTGEHARYLLEVAQREAQPISGFMPRRPAPLPYHADPARTAERRGPPDDLMNLAAVWGAHNAGNSVGSTAGPPSGARPLTIIPAPPPPDVSATGQTPPGDTIPSPPCISEPPPDSDAAPPPSSPASPEPEKPESSSAMSRLLRERSSMFMVALAAVLFLAVIAVALRAATNEAPPAHSHALDPMLPRELRPIFIVPIIMQAPPVSGPAQDEKASSPSAAPPPPSESLMSGGKLAPLHGAKTPASPSLRLARVQDLSCPLPMRCR